LKSVEFTELTDGHIKHNVLSSA